LGAIAVAIGISATIIALATSTTPPTRFASSAAGARWDGTFAHGFSRWLALEALPGDATIQAAPGGRQGLVARFVVNPGDVPARSGERAEAVASQRQTAGYEGRTVLYHWSTYFPADFNPAPDTTWNIFAQWHETSEDHCHPNLALAVDTRAAASRLRLAIRGGRMKSSGLCEPTYSRAWDLAPLQTGHWYDFSLRVRWSAHSGAGTVLLSVDGRPVAYDDHATTLYRGQRVYLKQGLYRQPWIETSTVFQTGVVRTLEPR
jgi:hypothetical protein